MRLDSINDLLTEAQEIFDLIKGYKTIPKPKVKSILEHLRSSLEYVACDINDQLTTPKQKIYFPYGESLEDFNKSIKRNFPSLLLELPDIYKEIEEIQGYMIGDDWLSNLCKLTNDVKHNNALDVRDDREVISSSVLTANGVNIAKIRGDGSVNINFYGSRVNGKLMDDIVYSNNEIKILKKRDVSASLVITKKRKILIGDQQIDLLPFLSNCINNIGKFVSRLYLKLKSV